MRAKKHLGQNFLKSNTIVKDMVRAANVSETDTVLEIGPGKGVLTKMLLETGARVVAVEKDVDLLPILEETFAKELASGQLSLLNEDILNISIDKLNLPTTYKIVANIPYYITGEIMRFFLSAQNQPDSITLMVQKEVAERIVARDGKESVLSLSVKLYGEPHYIKKVPARYFSPQPKIDSAIIHISDISRDKLDDIDEQSFFHTVKSGFQHKRKLLAGNLKGIVSGDAFTMCEIQDNARAENIPLEKWICLSSFIK